MNFRLPPLSAVALLALAFVLPFTVTRRLAAQTSTAASGAPTSSSGKPVMVAPRLLSSPIVAYPPGATGNAVVVLLVLVRADGTVDAATATEGEEPFITAAVEAAQTWTFVPATKDGVPIPSKTRFRLAFAPPVQLPVAPTASASTSATTGVIPPATSSAVVPVAPPPKRPKAVDLIVEGEKLAAAVTSFSKAEVRELPGAFGDPFRAVEVLPGVTPIVSGLPFFYVRGSPPGNVGYYVDGVRVPYLFHVGLGPSVIHPGMIDRVDLYPGGYPARFGRYAGGIVSGETAPPRFDFHGEGNIRVFDAGALVETGFADGKGSALLAFRYSYTATVLSLIAKEVKLDYRDYQARVSYDLTDRDRITLFSFGAYDLLGQRKNDSLNILFGSEFYRADLRWEHSFGPRTTLLYAVTLGFDQTRIADNRNARNNLAATRFEFHHAFNDGILLRMGGDATLDAYQSTLPQYADPDSPTAQKFASLFPPRTDRAGGIWLDFVLTPTKRIELTPGVRMDFYRSVGANAFSVDPRLAARFAVSDKVKIIHAYGLAHQAPSFVVPVPGLSPGSLSNGLQTSFQTSAGVEVALPENITGTATVFHNAFFKMTDALGTTQSLEDPLTDKRSSGQAIGFELFLRKRLSQRIGGFFSYTLSRSTRTLDGNTFFATFDRTHVATAAIAYDVGRHWRFGTRLVFYTGAPKQSTVPHGLITPPPTLTTDRDPAFYRIDLRVEKRWNFGEKAWLAFVMELLNATLHKETISNETIGPVTIPSFGIEGAM